MSNVTTRRRFGIGAAKGEGLALSGAACDPVNNEGRNVRGPSTTTKSNARTNKILTTMPTARKSCLMSSIKSGAYEPQPLMFNLVGERGPAAPRAKNANAGHHETSAVVLSSANEFGPRRYRDRFR